MKLTKKFNYPFKVLLLILNMCCASLVMAQQLTLVECIDLALSNSPLQENNTMLASIRELDALNNNVSNYPSISLTGTAHYQSDVFELPFTFPGSDIPEIPKDQFNLYVNLNQKVYDGGMSRASRSIDQVKNDLDLSELDSRLYQTRTLVTDVYFGILLVQENRKVLELLDRELTNQINRAEVSHENGILLKSQVNELRIEKLSNEQKIRSLDIRESSLYDLMSDLTGIELATPVFLPPDSIIEETDINRPELKVFRKQSDLLIARQLMVESVNRPKVAGFARVGYGRPNPYNFFETDPDNYYMIGASVHWNLWDWKTAKREAQKLRVHGHLVTSERENFLERINHQFIRKRAEIDDLKSTIETDERVLKLQEEIEAEARNQYELGTLSTTDYLSAVTKKTSVELQLNKHKTDLMKAKIELSILTGNMP